MMYVLHTAMAGQLIMRASSIDSRIIGMHENAATRWRCGLDERIQGAYCDYFFNRNGSTMSSWQKAILSSFPRQHAKKRYSNHADISYPAILTICIYRMAICQFTSLSMPAKIRVRWLAALSFRSSGFAPSLWWFHASQSRRWHGFVRHDDAGRTAACCFFIHFRWVMAFWCCDHGFF